MRSVKKPQVEAVQALINLKLVAVSESYIYGNICHRLGLMYLQRPKKTQIFTDPNLCPFQPIHGVVLFQVVQKHSELRLDATSVAWVTHYQTTLF